MRLPSIVTDLVSKIRRDEVAFPAQAGMLELLGAPNTRYDYAKRVVPMQNSALAAGVNFFAQMFSEAPVAVFDATDGQPGEVKEGHDLAELIRRPNPFYPGITLMIWTIIEYLLTGNAYWLKTKNAQGTPDGLWLLPTSTVEPKRPNNGSEFISHYEYNPGQAAIKFEVDDIVHFRDGLDPANNMKGVSRLRAVMREVWTDDEAANFTASLLRNFAVPGVILTPEDSSVGFDADKRNEIRRAFTQTFGGDNRGRVMIASGKTKVDVVSFSPKDMDMESLRAIPESRIAAALGIPAAIIGYLTGMRSTAVGATMAELREMAYESGIIPVQRQFAEQLDLQLMPSFRKVPAEHVAFDNRAVRVLQEDADNLTKRTVAQVTAGILKVDDAQRILGLPVDDTQSAYLRNLLTTTLVPSGEGAALPLPDDGDAKTADDAAEDFPDLKVVGD